MSGEGDWFAFMKMKARDGASILNLSCFNAQTFQLNSFATLRHVEIENLARKMIKIERKRTQLENFQFNEFKV